MLDYAARFILKIRSNPFFRAIQRTLVMLMPIAVLGSYFKLILDLIFSPEGMVYNIFGLDKIIPDHLWYAGLFVSRGMIEVTFGVFGVYACFFMARYTAHIYHKDATLAGLTSVIILLFCSYGSTSGQRSGNVYSSGILQINSVFISLVVGYMVGQVFHLLGKEYLPVKVESTKIIRQRAWDALLPAMVSLSIGIILGIIIYELQLKVINSASFSEIVSRVQTTNNIGEVIILTIVITFLNWIGIGFPLRSIGESLNNAYTAENMTVAFQHGSSWNVPYKFLGSSLINSYGVMGGASILLAIIVLLLLQHNNPEIEAIAKVNLLPAAFGSTIGLAVGLPILLDPIFLLPSMLIPIINILLAAGAIYFRLIPVCVYPILKGTPGILISFFGTNGNWSALFFTILLFILDIAMLWPIIKINDLVNLKLRSKEGRTINAQKS
ncbi:MULTISPECIES: PTS sugar transporter subunit IIC [unclassified Lactobacillus]|uniref:PTS sugar transporter subunit IIC n=1 Tax=unclassified Lactobacillus TaxID=2620435 RepID=UPI000EFD34E1|nr:MULTISPECIES: PTS sugar transporter subunit IIC [unclassified Lactobacillus]RMC23524.1 PTS sugar transporter subunit IIC [Lactobacillus sp. ESL0247]RMC27321.1 PTS sugar transporter subunit IIC [Lactobacillus sp. ESL0246]RMC30386.1 PTS sugar transporter subunit IIC [Lactobacillus sp. ESL0245]